MSIRAERDYYWMKSLGTLALVFEAAAGNATPLAQFLRSGEALGEIERGALALLIEGKLVPWRAGRGKRDPIHLAESEDQDERLKLANAAQYYHTLMKFNANNGRKYGVASEVLEYVSKVSGIDIEQLQTFINRPLAYRFRDFDRRAQGEEDIVGMFQRWFSLNDRT